MLILEIHNTKVLRDSSMPECKIKTFFQEFESTLDKTDMRLKNVIYCDVSPDLLKNNA